MKALGKHKHKAMVNFTDNFLTDWIIMGMGILEVVMVIGMMGFMITMVREIKGKMAKIALVA